MNSTTETGVDHPNRVATIIDRLGSLSYAELIAALHDDPQWAWSDPYWTRSSVIAEDSYGGKFQVKNGDSLTNRNLNRIGCSGSIDKNVVWLGWDFDVGHGADSFSTQKEAMDEALRLRRALGCGEIRGSSGGRGFSLRMLLPQDTQLPFRLAKVLIKRGPKAPSTTFRFLIGGFATIISYLGGGMLIAAIRRPFSPSFIEVSPDELKSIEAVILYGSMVLPVKDLHELNIEYASMSVEVPGDALWMAALGEKSALRFGINLNRAELEWLRYFLLATIFNRLDSAQFDSNMEAQ